MPEIDADGPKADTKTVAAGDAAFSAPQGDAVAVGADAEGKDWSAGAIIVCDGKAHDAAKSDKRPVIYVEAWSDPVIDKSGSATSPAARKADGYPSNGALYVRSDPDTDFGSGGPVVTIGVDVRQAGLWGFAERPGFVCVGPGMPAYAAANIAYQNGSRDKIDIYGLTERQKGLLQPYLAYLAAASNETVTEGSGHAPAAPDATILLK